MTFEIVVVCICMYLCVCVCVCVYPDLIIYENKFYLI